MGSPPPPPPPGVDTNLGQKPGQAPKTLRELLEQHRKNPTCFACHGIMDPLGFALENFNTVGQYETFDRDTLTLLDASGVLPDGTVIKKPEDLTRALVSKPDQFVQSLTERLMTYALGREVTYLDMPTVRRVVKAAEKDDYRFASLVYNVISTDAFRKRDGKLSANNAESNQQASL